MTPNRPQEKYAQSGASTRMPPCRERLLGSGKRCHTAWTLTGSRPCSANIILDGPSWREPQR
ncbi:MAG: hypothetical protein WBC96_05595, partial [Thermodesulfobacteriota bacterium]